MVRVVGGVALWAVLLGGCQGLETAATGESALEEEPSWEFTLEAQAGAVAARDAERKQAYVPGLRKQLPPSEWIEHAYHGQVVDANFEPIAWDPPTIAAIQASMFDVLYPLAGGAAQQKFGKDLAVLFTAAGLSPGEQIVARETALHGLSIAADQAKTELLRWRLGVLHGGVATGKYVISPAVQKWIASHGIPVFNPQPPPGAGYIAQCEAEGVPIPPSWPDKAWGEPQPLIYNFLSGPSTTVEVHTYEDPSAPPNSGICYALPRTEPDGTITFLGIICQNNLNGKACFWDNITRDNARRLVDPETDFPLVIGEIGDGMTLSPCTNCHRGDNAFIVHPGTALDVLPRARRRAASWYTPLGRPEFVNPGPLSLAAPPAGQLSCTGCHNLPRPSRSYCTDVLRPASIQTMPERPYYPPGSTTFEPAAGWVEPGRAIRVDYAAHVVALSSMCASL